ncbi:MAG: hypothetical protein LBP28_02850, partial [Coriobacteriales bacterium]|nr:hypothetical protein [Coriobacteriales bacterium]
AGAAQRTLRELYGVPERSLVAPEVAAAAAAGSAEAPAEVAASVVEQDGAPATAPAPASAVSAAPAAPAAPAASGRNKIVAAGRFGAGASINGDGHAGRGLIIGSGWDKELARDLDCDYLPAAAPCPYRLVLTSNYAGYSGGLRVIEDIYDIVLATYA